jgi:thioredoxin reductase
VYTNGSEDLTQQVQELTKGSTSVSVDARPIQGMVTEANAAREPGIIFSSFSGSRDAPETVSHRFFVHNPNASPNVSFARSLGLEMAPSRYEVKSGPPFNTTNVPGCYVVGDVGSPIKIVSLALSGGSLAAAGPNMELR